VSEDTLLTTLPGADLVLRGVDDLARGQPTAEAALVEVALGRLRGLGLPVPIEPTEPGDADLRLYYRLGARYSDRDPYPIYNAWRDQLVSFLAALSRLRHEESRLGR
jgi:hypothetical protein